MKRKLIPYPSAALATLAALITLAIVPVCAAQQEPYVPKEQRIPSREPAASGDELRAKVQQKLRKRFDDADADHSGTLTKQEAEQAGLGYVAAHFAEIDTANRGEVKFEEVQAWMRKRAMAARNKP